MNPHHQQKRNIRQSCCHKFCSKPLFIAFFNFSHKRPTFAFMSESGYTLGSAQGIAHSGLHAETGGVSDEGAISTLGPFCTVWKPCAAWCQNGKLCRFLALAGGTLEERRGPAGQRCAYARRCPAGIAAPLGCVILFRFCRNCGLYALRSGAFRVCEARGGITTLGVLCVLLKCRTAACQKGSFAVF